MTDKKNKKGKRRSIWKFILKIFLGLILAFGLFAAYFFLTLPSVDHLIKDNPETTAMIRYRQKQAEEKGKKIKVRYRWIQFNKIPKLMKYAVRIAEDDKFYDHDGIDYDAIRKAFDHNQKSGRKARGGSTITQQLAKNLFLSPKKSYYRKLKEFFIAKKLEDNLSKDRIFCIYLNVIEFGPGVFGVGAAARYYFKKPVHLLNLEEILRLTAVIPKPLKVSPKGNSRFLKYRAKVILHRMFRYGNISDDTYYTTRKQFM